MNERRERNRRIVAVGLCVVMALALGSCAMPWQSGASDGQGTTSEGGVGASSGDGFGPASSGSGTQYASSMSEYIDQVMQWPGVTDAQREVLQRAKENGSMPVSDYEQAWSEFKVCFTGKGHEMFPLKNYNGIYKIPGFNFKNLTPEAHKQYDADRMACEAQISPITSVYEMQQGNPNLYRSLEEAMVDCLKRAGKVDASYTAKDLGIEMRDRNYTHFDIKDPVVRGCQTANNWHVTYADEAWVITY